ncbi:DUF1844 domain-containing protein [bacterium]|nr:DUF1844 domain-containing protein [bacterium]
MSENENANDATQEPAEDALADAAESEKGTAAEQSAEEAQPQQEADDAGAAAATFGVLVNSIATQVFVSLGLVENPVTKQKTRELTTARYSIDLLQVLAAKTKGNLTEMEDRYLQGVLHELRMHYVEAARQPAPSAAEPASK